MMSYPLYLLMLYSVSALLFVKLLLPVPLVSSGS